VRRTVPTILVTGACALLGACAVPGVPVVDGPGLEGTYVVNGVDPLGTEYSGVVIIGPGETPNEVSIQWLITGAILEGVGTVDGDRLGVEWSTVEGPRQGSFGTAAYTIADDGSLTGTRTVDGVDGSGTEEIFPET
jgi:hypothetical protein